MGQIGMLVREGLVQLSVSKEEKGRERHSLPGKWPLIFSVWLLWPHKQGLHGIISPVQ